eukprot:CAMPEP_0176423834 /NCGR_PEP_ID=MMETSP0127-20121128/10506_1 /TAXON_ID=938130 /ORGANISM="Platyophrya macrostoma, Strain WH" /LENGTH=975 /DNA_ID=CAMNT_0017804833 /DNA_START=27 /DNA_END=2954 /DNA_ORIENTATION=+
MIKQISKAFKPALSDNIPLNLRKSLHAPLYYTNTLNSFSLLNDSLPKYKFSISEGDHGGEGLTGQDDYDRKSYTNPLVLNIIPPKAMPYKLSGLLFDVLDQTPAYGNTHTRLLRSLINKSLKSLKSETEYEELKKKIASLPTHEMDILIRMLYVHQHVLQIEEATDQQFKTDKRETPVRKTIGALIDELGRCKAIELIPNSLVEVFTAHPVFADKESVLTRKEELSKNYKDWIRKNDIISHLPPNTPSYRDLRIEMDSLYDLMIESMSTMLQTDPVREVKISSAQEQENLRRRLAKLVHDCLLMSDFIKNIFQEKMLEHISQEFVDEGVADNSLKEILKRSRSYGRTQSLKNHEILKNHPEYQKILDKDFFFTLNVWAFDLDGNPNVTQETLMKSIAAGIKTLFLSEPFIERMEEIIPVSIHKEDEDLAEEVQRRLDEVEPYLSATLERTKDFAPLRRLCTVARRRITLTMQKCDDVLSSGVPGFYELLNHSGFKSGEEFLKFIDPLVQIEKRYNLDKVWTNRARIVKNFTLPIAECHFRIAETTNQNALAEYLHFLDHKRFPTHTSLLKLPEAEQIAIFQSMIDSGEKVKNKEMNKLSKANLETFRNWKVFSVLQKESHIVQSDSTSPEYSIPLLKALGTLFEFRGRYAPLFESKETMENAIRSMEKKEDGNKLFKNVRIMCAGSDNQKKMGLFLSAHYNISLMAMAEHQGLPSFLGKGCSVFRSKRLHGLTDMETCQPGRQREFLENPKEYLLTRFIRRMIFKQQITKLNRSEVEVMQKIASKICQQAYEGRKKHLQKLSPALNTAFTEYLEKSLSTAYSRPDKKAVAGGDLLTTIRAIVASKIKLYTSMHLDTDVGDIKEEVTKAISELKAEGITNEQIYATFKNPPYRAVTDAIIDFLELYDEKIAEEQDKQNVRINVQDVKDVYKMLTGEEPRIGPKDPYLRLIRLISLEAKRNPNMRYIPEFLFCRYPV